MGPDRSGPGLTTGRARGFLDQLDVLCAGPFFSVPLGERHSLSDLELIEAHPPQGGGVEKQVLFAPGADESKALVRESLDRAFRHGLVP